MVAAEKMATVQGLGLFQLEREKWESLSDLHNHSAATEQCLMVIGVHLPYLLDGNLIRIPGASLTWKRKFLHLSKFQTILGFKGVL